jgi:alkanesulfonate monooxygenase SsuD/methylene tetrahydromethanopterin reductase-like flavin-dependent oxidoreductase (luciferase family)
VLDERGDYRVAIGSERLIPQLERVDPAARLAEAVEILRRLLDGQEVTFGGEHYRLERARTLRARQERVPILVAVNGRQALAHAARHADIIGLAMLGRTLEDGQRHEVRWQPERLDRTVAFIREQAAGRATDLELNALVQRVVVTSDRHGAAEELSRQVTGLTVEDALRTPFLALGTHDQIAEHLPSPASHTRAARLHSREPREPRGRRAGAG